MTGNLAENLDRPRRGFLASHPQQFPDPRSKLARGARAAEPGARHAQLPRSFGVQVEYRDAGSVAEDLTGPGALQLLVRSDWRIRLRDRIVDLQQPAPQPAHRGDAARAGKAVRLVRFEEVDALAEAEPAIE